MDLVKVHKPEFLFLSETISYANKIEELRIKLGFAQCFSVDRVGRSGGLAVFWKNNVYCEITGYSRNHVNLNFLNNNVAVWSLSCFYGFPERSRRKDSWDLIRVLAGMSTLPWFIIGDFNDLLAVSDKWGGTPHAQSLMAGFQAAIDDSMLVEIDLQGGKFTWEKSRGTADWVKERLDRAFASRSWLHMFPLSKLSLIHTSVSDHDPIFLDLLSVSFSSKQFRFRFENTWLQEPGFHKETTDFWLALPPSHILPKLLSVSNFMARWGRNFFHKFRDKVKKKKELLSILVNRVDSEGVKLYFEEKERLNELLFHEEIYWKQRAKVFWLTEGDANTKFFHASASTRRKTNRVAFLETDSGVQVSDNEGMCNMVKDYFVDIFKGDQSSPSLSVEEEHRCVSDAQNRMLVAELSFAEFTIAVKQMHPDKSSGPDGLNPAFFQQFWPVLGKEVYSCCRDWLKSNSFPANLNDTNVVLIPKKENACRMKDLRPIALCNVLYKILSKVLANRLKSILPRVITENQAAFVPDRSINDNVLVAFELIHHMKKATGGGEGDVALKLDISKAYDRVDWGYLKSRMQAMGFCTQWIRWMMMCVSTVSYDFCFNGTSIGPIIPSRGIRQGDPISPYLFLFCVEGLSLALNKAVAEESIHGIKVSSSAPVISHLLFADDSFLFFRANISETEVVKTILDEYARCSGQSINYQKSGICFSSNVRVDKQVEISTILGVTSDLQDSMYLGLPSLVGRSKKRVFGFVKERLWKRLQGWKAKKISRAGKTVLINNVATAVPSYCMSSFLLPKSMCNEMEVMLNKYWWQSGSTDRRGINWIRWDGLSMSKCKGGLAFRNLYGYNVALMAKHVWKFIYNPQSLVSRLFKAKYFPDSHILQAKAGSGSSFIWQGIITARNEVLQGYRWVLGDGELINCVKDPWLVGKRDFKVDQSREYGVNVMSVKQLFLSNGRDWDSNKVRSLFSEEDASLILATRIPIVPVVDRLAWSKTSNGKYSVKTGYQLWHAQNIGTGSVPQSNGWSKLWKLDLPHKVNLFLWRLCRNNVPVKSRLSSKGVNLPLECPMCNSDIENLLHIFFLCPFARACWHYAGQSYDLSNDVSVPSWLLDKIDSTASPEALSIAKVLWGIWFFRNKKVWESKVVTANIAMEWSAKSISEWREAKALRSYQVSSRASNGNPGIVKWRKPEVGVLKLNVDAAVKLGAATFSMGLVIRDHTGAFVSGKAVCADMVSSVVEAEALAILEGLQWLSSMNQDRAVIESDSFLAVKALLDPGDNLLEIGHILNACNQILDAKSGFSVAFVKRQANKVAHLVAKLPCSLDCQNVITAPSGVLLESILYDVS